jgi:hypothetical protein
MLATTCAREHIETVQMRARRVEFDLEIESCLPMALGPIVGNRDFGTSLRKYDLNSPSKSRGMPFGMSGAASRGFFGGRPFGLPDTPFLN